MYLEREGVSQTIIKNRLIKNGLPLTELDFPLLRLTSKVSSVAQCSLLLNLVSELCPCVSREAVGKRELFEL